MGNDYSNGRGSWETFIDHLMNRGVDTVIILHAFLGDRIKDRIVRKTNERVRCVEPKASEPSVTQNSAPVSVGILLSFKDP